VVMFTVPPLRKRFGDGPREHIPMTYPSKLPLLVLFGQRLDFLVKGLFYWRA